MVGNEANESHKVDEEMENVSQSSPNLDKNSVKNCQILNISNGTNNELAATHVETTHSSDKNVISVDDNENHEIDTNLERENGSSVVHLNCKSEPGQFSGKDSTGNFNVLGLGKEFESEDQAYKSYLEYATLEGFNIRKDFVNKDYDGMIKSRRFTCSKEGYRRPKRGTNPKNHREDKRSGCLAHMTISLRPNGKYRVIHFETNHNHVLDNIVEILPSQNRFNFPQDEDGNIIDIEDEAPKLGMKFDSEDHAYEYYSTYALLAGFSIRKDYVNRSKKDGGVSSRRFTCCRGGLNNKEKNDSSAKRPRKETRIGCLAQLIIVRHSDKKYHVTHYEGKHNHELVPACRIGLFRSQKRPIIDENVEDSSDKPVGDAANLSYNPVDSENTLSGKRKSDMKEGESESIFQYFENKKKKDPSLFYVIQPDAEGQMANVFWADAKMVTDYHFFSDVVCFDTTYKLGENCQPFVSFIGVNHHKQMLIFGAALLYDDTFESYNWLFKTFLKVMSQKKPTTIITDQDDLVSEVINSLLPDINHRMCAWYMYQKALKSISGELLGSNSFTNDLMSCFFNLDHEEDFIKAWEFMLQSSDHWQNKVLSDILREREKWAMPYGRHMLCADIKYAQLSGNFLLKVRKYIKSGVDILLCLNQFAKLLKDWRYNEVQANYDMSNQLPRLMGDIIMLKGVRDLYTPTIFELFQKEYEICLDFLVEKCNENVPMIEFKVGTFGEGREYIVKFDASEDSVACNCMKFEFEGILCSHAIKVLDYQNIKVVPSRYILKRWTKTARI